MSDPKPIALIIPLRLTGATYEGDLRLRRLCDTVPQDLFEIIISDYGTANEHCGPIDELQRAGIRVVRHPAPTKLFSIGRSRDFGVSMAQSPVIMFNDVDFIATEATYRAIHAEVMRRDIALNRFDFFCVPVAFLTAAGTQQWLEADDDAKPLSDVATIEGYERARGLVESTAYGSSAIVANREHYLSIGGHDPGFAGHGAEDYDLLHRLSALVPRGPRPRDYYKDYGYNSPKHYWGFRPFFALYGLDVAKRGIHLVHLSHPRRQEKGYFRPRANFRHLRRVMQRFDRTGQHPLPIPGYQGSEKWSVIIRDVSEVELLRQLLVRCGSYSLVRMPSRRGVEAIKTSLKSAAPDRVILSPPLAAQRPGLAGEIRSLGYRVTIPPMPPHAVIGDSGTALFHYWTDLECEGLPALHSGEIPRPLPVTDRLFESFGGAAALNDPAARPPTIRIRSSRWTRFKRWVTGL